MDRFPYTDEQKAIINASPENDYRVMAVPGSGKTEVLIQFAGKLVESHEFSPSEILMVTFSVSATKEMRERLRLITGEAGKVDISTLHSLCYRICRDRENNSPYARRKVENWPSWRTQQSVRDFLREYYNVKPWDADKLTREVVASYEESKRWPVGQWIQEHDPVHPVVRCPYMEVFEYIEQCKREEEGIEFDDMPQYALELLDKNKKLKRDWQKRYRYIIVDEFQDTDRCQYAVLMHLAAGNAKMLVVGDLFQSVYGFRAAVPELMASEIEKDRPSIMDMPLNYNFRSGKKIINVANSILANATKHSPSTIVPKPDAGPGYLVKGSVPLIHTHLQKLHDSGCPLHEIAVLNRYNADTLEAEACCIKNNIPYVVYGRFGLHDNPVITASINYLRLVYGLDKEEVLNSAFTNVMNVPLRKIPKKAAREIVRSAKRDGEIAIEYLIGKNGYVTNKDYINLALHSMAQNVVRIRGFIRSMKPNLGQVLGQIRRLFDLDNHFKADAEQFEDPEASLDQFQELLAGLQNIDELNVFLEKMQNLKGAEDDKKDRVQLLTGHKAKGLEFQAVFVHAEEGKFPKENCNIEEERNLFYVMVTRAKDILYLSGNSQFVEQAVKGKPLDRNLRYDQLFGSPEESEGTVASANAQEELPF